VLDPQAQGYEELNELPSTTVQVAATHVLVVLVHCSYVSEHVAEPQVQGYAELVELPSVTLQGACTQITW
jgi:hypothetical protein